MDKNSPTTSSGAEPSGARPEGKNLPGWPDQKENDHSKSQLPGNRKSPLKHRGNSEISDEENAQILPTKRNPLYNLEEVLKKLDDCPTLKILGEGKYYVSMKSTVTEKHQKQVFKKRNGQIVPIIRKEVLGPVESVFSRFCEEVLGMSRAKFLPMTSQGERHLIWVGRTKAKHIIKFLKGNGSYTVNRFPGDVFLKDKQVLGVTMRQYMLEKQNKCFWRCGEHVKDMLDEVVDKTVTSRICKHMVHNMRTDGCDIERCFNYGRRVCKHFDIFIPEVQSFSMYNSLQEFSNRLSNDLKGQLFICKPSYLYKGLGFRFFRNGAEFEEFYHMTFGKETSRHDFMVQRVVSNPYLFNGRKVDIRAFLLVMTLRNRRVVAFVNAGFCRIASAEYKSREKIDENEDQDKSTDQLKLRDLLKKRSEELELNMTTLVCPYITQAERADRAKRMAENRLYKDREDRSKELDEVFRSEALLAKIEKQIQHIGYCLAAGIERRIWDAYGCYQIFSMDMCMDANLKLWLLEVNSHAMSEIDMLSPTQRVVVPAVLMEALGLVVECMYKSTNGHRLRKDPRDEFKDTGFLFGQNFRMVFSTLNRRRTNAVPPRRAKPAEMMFHERIAMADALMLKAARRRQAQDELSRHVNEQNEALRKKREAKSDEES